MWDTEACAQHCGPGLQPGGGGVNGGWAGLLNVSSSEATLPPVLGSLWML